MECMTYDGACATTKPFLKVGTQQLVPATGQSDISTVCTIMFFGGNCCHCDIIMSL